MMVRIRTKKIFFEGRKNIFGIRNDLIIDILAKHQKFMPTYLYGDHGTCRSIAQMVRAEGFQIENGRLNRVGPGAYFWKRSPYSSYLAKNWHSFSLKRGAYTGQSDLLCEVIGCRFDVEEGDILDFESSPNREIFEAAYYSEHHFKTLKGKELNTFFEVLVQKIEARLAVRVPGFTFKVLIKRLAPPPCDYPISVLGAPTCYIARDVSCMRIGY